MYQMSLESVEEMRGSGTDSREPLYLVALRNGVVRKYEYRNNIGPDWGPGQELFEWTVEAEVEPHIAAGIAEVGGQMRAASSTESLILPPNTPGMPSDVFEAMKQSSFDDDISYWIKLNTHANFFNRAADALKGISGRFFDPETLLRVYMKLQWPDGSSALYGWDSNQKTWVRLENTARDGRGNLIPENRSQIDGKQYNFPGAAEPGSPAADDFTDMWNHLRSMDVPINDARGGLGGYGYYMTCTPGSCDIYIIPQ